MADDQPVIIAMIADIPPGGAKDFQAYERQVLALLDRHGGHLDRRLRTADERVEVHLVSFATRAGYQGYLEDPERLAHRQQLAHLDLGQRILEMTDVVPPLTG